ncbi:MAG: DUF1501 domain-containing protein [Actinomycetota bacterium]
MTNEPTPSRPTSSGRIETPRSSRRRFLQLAGLGAVGATGAFAAPTLVGRLMAEESTTGNFGPSPGGSTGGSGGRDPGRILVSIQLGGGLDFLNTVVPLDDPRYATVRGDGTLRLGEDGDGAPTLHQLDSSFALNSTPYLAERWNAGELAIVHGVGSEGSSLSHFDATDMWEKGSPDFGTSSGWLGRAMADLAGADPDPLLAVSMGGVSPSMYADGWSPVGLRPEARIPWSANFSDQYRSLDRAMADLTSSDGDDLWARTRNSQLDLRGIGARLGPIVDGRELRDDEDDEDDEDIEEGGPGAGFLGYQLDLIADLVRGGIPTRAFHVMHDGFDTHGSQRYLLPELMGTLDAALQRFQSRLGPDADRVVIATWTEFGRRPEWNGQGTEHGTAGVQFVLGPGVRGGHHGEPPPLDRFDPDGNFLITTDFRDYLAGLTHGVLGADPARVVDGGRGPLDLLEA